MNHTQNYNEYNPNEIYVVSIDIGVKHLALCLSSIHENFTIKEIIWFDLIDITTFVHLDDQAKKDCKLYHDKTVSDYLDHVFYLHHNLFDISKYILIERQPPTGYTVVEQLIFNKFRSKCVLVHPCSVKAFFKNSDDYEKRKEESINIAQDLLKKQIRNYLLEYFNGFPRKHDISDTIGILHYWSNKKFLEYIKQENERKINERLKQRLGEAKLKKKHIEKMENNYNEN